MKEGTLSRKLLIYLGSAAGCIIGVYLAFKLAFYFAPFLIAVAVAIISEPLIRLLNQKLKIPRKIACIFTLLIALAILGTLVTLLILKIISLAEEFYYNIDKYYNILNTSVNKFMEMLNGLYLELPDELSANLREMIINLTSSLTVFLKSFAKGIYTMAISIPDAVIFIIITILATYFITSDRAVIRDSIKSHIPGSWIKKGISIKEDMFSALFGYVRAQLILMSVTFTELSIGFLIIGVKNAIIIALLISIFDALPIFGTGGILIPWMIISFLSGNATLGFSLLILYGVVLIVRQLIEPKVLGTQIGVHPLVTLFSMYLGLKIFGVLGMIAGPITVLLLKNVFRGLNKNTTLKEIFEGSEKSGKPSGNLKA
ncbi:MAG TPA: sporulation integral membrane protein YtvI [Clostridiaceae bacterium]|nr:sporulation integral membrane protein YtvI [Clostridiaceae bacterium]